MMMWYIRIPHHKEYDKDDGIQNGVDNTEVRGICNEWNLIRQRESQDAENDIDKYGSNEQSYRIYWSCWRFPMTRTQIRRRVRQVWTQ